MPSYAYRCLTCEHEFEDFHLMSEPHPKRCPKCGKKISQIFDNHQVTPLCYGNATTVGQQAEENTRKLGREGHQKMVEADCKARKLKSPTKKKELPWYRDGSVEGTKRLDKPLNISKIKDTKKFIETGEQ